MGINDTTQPPQPDPTGNPIPPKNPPPEPCAVPQEDEVVLDLPGEEPKENA